MPRGELTDYAAELGQAMCLKLVQERFDFVHPDQDRIDEQLRGQPGWREDEDTGCWLWVGRVLPEGYAQIKRKTPAQVRAGESGKNAGKNFLFHRIAYTAYAGRDVLHGASHLCDRPACFNPDHIADEPINMNNARKGCVGELKCFVHGTVIVNLCVHTPPCIRPARDDIKCCLTEHLEQTLRHPPRFGASRPSSSSTHPYPWSSSPQRPQEPRPQISSPHASPSGPPRSQPPRGPPPPGAFSVVEIRSSSPNAPGSSRPTSSHLSPAKGEPSPTSGSSPVFRRRRIALPPPSGSPMSLDSDPVPGPGPRRPRTNAAQRMLQTDAASLPGADRLPFSDPADYTDDDGFVVGDDVVEFESSAGQLPSDL